MPCVTSWAKQRISVNCSRSRVLYLLRASVHGLGIVVY